VRASPRLRAVTVLSTVTAVLALAAGCGGSERHAAATPTPHSPFAYDARQPIDLDDRGRVNGSSYPIAVRNVSYAVPGGRVDGYLAVPPGRGRLPAVVYLHGAGGGRGELLVPAVWLAGRGAVGLTITMPSSRAGPRPGTAAQALATERRLFVANVVAVRRALDLLQRLPRVDRARIGLVGWSLGARVGAVLAGLEPRLEAVVLMSGGATPVAAYVAGAPAALRPAVRRALTLIDPLRWIARARPGRLLLQDGREDRIVPRSALLALAQAAPRGTELRWYAAPHALNVSAYRDQLAWLSRKLGIRGPAVPGAKTGP
jgi:uncharacterized protein